MIEPWLAMLLAKMAVAAAIVVGCSLLAERVGPLLAAMIATLPISAGPVYVFLAMDHDAACISAGALGSMGSNLANAGLSLVYVLLAQRFGTALSLAAALLSWLVIAAAPQALALPLAALVAATPIVFLARQNYARARYAIFQLSATDPARGRNWESPIWMKSSFEK